MCTSTPDPGDELLGCLTAMLLQLAAAKAWWLRYSDVSAAAMVVRVQLHPCRGGGHHGASQTAAAGALHAVEGQLSRLYIHRFSCC